MGFFNTKVSAFSPEKYEELNSGLGKIRNWIAAKLYERPNNIKKRQDKFNLLRNFFYKRLAFFIGNRAFNRKMELISQEQQVQRAIITNKDIIEDLNKIMLRVQQNSISEEELFKFFAEKTCVWTDLAATAIFKTVILPDDKKNPDIKTGKRLKFQLVAQGIHPNKNNYRAYEWASGAAKLLGKDSYIFILEKYLRLKEKGLGKEGVFARLVFDIESYYVESQKQMPFDMYVSNNEEDVISLTDPLSSGGVPTGRIPEIGYAAGGILFSHDDDSKGHIKSKGYVLETLAELIGAIIQKSDKQVILDGLVNLLAVLSDYHIRESFNREQAAQMKLMQMQGIQAKVLNNTKDLKLLKEGVWVSQIKKNDDIFSVVYDGGSFEAHSILIATGSTRRKLEVKGAQEYENKGITYCASCDGPLFSGQDVTVIGGGNAALETVAQLVAYCKSVTLLHRSETFRADEITVQKVLTHEKVTVHKNVEVLEVKGEQFVNAIVWKDKTSGSITEQLTSGIFVEIGQIPSTQFAEGFLTLDENKKITIDPWTQRTSVEGIWCAGDASNGLYHQNNIAAGDAVKALEDIYMWLHKKK
jgi:thioredoxin reductase